MWFLRYVGGQKNRRTEFLFFFLQIFPVSEVLIIFIVEALLNHLA